MAIITVLGAGSWGTALAMSLARNQHHVCLWSNDPEQLNSIEQTGINSQYLPDYPLPEGIKVKAELSNALGTGAVDKVDQLVIAVPSHAVREVLTRIQFFVYKHVNILIASKGIDPKDNKLMHDVVKEFFPDNPIAVLSGPSFAKEVAANMPTAITIASEDKKVAQHFSELFHSETFRPYLSDDVTGVELGGVVKNVLAIAVGIADGLGFGSNTRCALITRGLAEMTRLGAKMGAQQQTFLGLSGLGDLVLTCTDNQSRNRRFGLALGQGKNFDQAQQEIGQVVEGFYNAKQVYNLAQQHQVEMPITEQVYKILSKQISPQQAVAALLQRELKTE